MLFRNDNVSPIGLLRELSAVLEFSLNDECQCYVIGEAIHVPAILKPPRVSTSEEHFIVGTEIIGGAC